MFGGRQRRGRRHRTRCRRAVGVLERLESRLAMAAGISLDRSSRTVTINGTAGNDSAVVRQQGVRIVVSLTTPAGRSSQAYRASVVSQIAFAGFAGNDAFSNLTGLPSRADGGPGVDVLRGGRAADEFSGGDGDDQLLGNAGDDALDGGGDNDVLRGAIGNDRLMGGGGLDLMLGQDGVDELWGGDDSDALDGGGGDDRLYGEGGDDDMIGGAGDDIARGGDGGDVLLGGLGIDTLAGGENDDWLDGGVDGDRLLGEGGLDRESDPDDGFADGDADGDGYDDDYDAWDILYEIPGNPSAYADDATVGPILASVRAELVRVLGISTDDPGLRVRAQNGQFGNFVTGVWRYLTPDKIQVWAKWVYPVDTPSQLSLFAQYFYTGPYSGNIADYTNPENYGLSPENRLYVGYIVATSVQSPSVIASRPGINVNWLPDQAVSVNYLAVSKEYTGFAPPLERLRSALQSMPNYFNAGDSFTVELSTEPGFQGLQPILDLLRSISAINATWYAEQRAAARR